MNALGRWLLGVKAEPKPELRVPSRDGVLPTDLLVRCPDCHSERAKPSLLILRQSFVRPGIGVVSIVDGDRLGCQECGSIFSVDSHGIFRQSANAAGSPWNRQASVPPTTRGEQPPQEVIEPRAPLLPTPLARPRV